MNTQYNYYKDNLLKLMKTYLLKKLFLISAVSVLIFFTHSDYTGLNAQMKRFSPREAVVTGNGLRVRLRPALDAPEIMQLAEFTIVEASAETVKTEQVGSSSAKWYFIRYGKKEGWCFGGFLAFPDSESSDGNFSIWRNNCWDEIIIIRNKKKNRFFKINNQGATTTVSTSGSYKYLAVDSGTDTIRGVDVYDISTGAKVYSAAYHDSFDWNGDSLIFNRVTYVGDCCHLWEETIVENGKARKGKKTGKGSYHCFGGVDETCRNFIEK